FHTMVMKKALGKSQVPLQMNNILSSMVMFLQASLLRQARSRITGYLKLLASRNRHLAVQQVLTA
ncbi:MAG: hypothetical protein CSA20_02675, partial [Deltaproteobacteria bacterium]